MIYYYFILDINEYIQIIAHIVDIIRQLEGKHLRILVCAHSNVAVDQGE
jgi:hypothetical protein